MKKQKRLIIVGGGFAGSYIAKKLENYFDTILIDNKDYFEFTPGILKTIVQHSYIKKIQVLHDHYLKNAKFYRGNVIEVSKSYVLMENRKIKFDYLVIASGSSYKKPIKQPNVLISTRAITLKNNFDKLSKAKKILIIGGGIVGVELASEIAYEYEDKKITLVHSGKNLIQRESPKASKYAEEYLKKNNIRIIFNKRITKIRSDFCETDKQRKICFDLIFLCVGIKPNSKFMNINFKHKLDEKKFIKTNNYLQLEGFKNIFVAGDVTNIKEEKLAQNAENHAEIIIQNLKNLEKNKRLLTYKPKQRVKVISLGQYNGILTYKKFIITGIIPAILKNLIEINVMKRYS